MTEILNIPTDEIKFLIRRDRDPGEFALIKEAIREIGIRQPLQVRDITSWKPADRRRPDGGLFKWEALFGEGRTTAAEQLFKETKEARWRTVPAIVLDVPQGEVLARFLAENLLREDIPWLDRAELLRSDLNAGVAPDELAKKHHLSANHVSKLLRVLKQTSPKIMEAVRKLTVMEAETLSRLPHSGQEIVVEALREAGMAGSQTPAVVHMAQEQIAKTGSVSKSALVGGIARLKQTVADQRKVLKLKRTHLAIGPQIYGEELLQDRKLTKMLDERGIKWKPFMEVYQK